MKFISTVFQIYQRFLIYIGGFQNISAILNLYRRFFKYIDLPTKSTTQKTHSLESGSSPITYFPKIEEAALITVLNSFRLYVVRIQSCSHQILEDFWIIRQPLVRSFYIILHILRCTDNYVLLSSAVTLGAICAIFELLINNFLFPYHVCNHKLSPLHRYHMLSLVALV